MKDNISIIFATIIGTFLIVLLPLYSILDRQDSMSYNVVLTSTTNFVDNIRNNGFIDRDSYYNYIAALASTSNTYKVTIEAYKKVLIQDTDEYGNIIPDSYVEEVELYNTQDILKVLEGESKLDVQDSNVKNNVYLFNENDEIYVKVHNTNITSGSIIYNTLSNSTSPQVINVSYGGLINNINWELYDKIQSETTQVPEVIMSVPVNAVNSTNIKRVNNDLSLENIDCTLENLDQYIGETSVEELCDDITYSLRGENYTYLYDLTDENNETIKIAVELRRIKTINTGVDLNTGEEIYTDIDKLSDADFNRIKSYIISEYIQLNGMYANIDLNLRQSGDYYIFDIILTNVRMSSLDYISSLASVTILPGIGQDENGTLSIGAETVQIELTDDMSVNTTAISVPHNWKKLLKTKSVSDSRILDSKVYSKQEIAFIISYTGINEQTDEDIVEAIRRNLKTYISDASISNIEIFTTKEMNDEYGINFATVTAGHVVVKFSYNYPNNSKLNYIELLGGWIATNIEDVVDGQEGEELVTFASGAKSSQYQVLLDNSAPLEPRIELEGITGNNGWFVSDVTLNLIPPRVDTVKTDIVIENSDGTTTTQQREEIGGSGVYKTSVQITGSIQKDETELSKLTLDTDGISYAVGETSDYVGNTSRTEQQEIKIDKTAPSAPKVTLSGTKGENGWFVSNVTLKVTPGTDSTSGVDKTTYKVEGSNELDETIGTSYTITKNGKSTFIATTYDKAGNKTETKIDVYIDKEIPNDANIKVVKGTKNSPNIEWYYTDVTLSVELDVGKSVSGLGTSSYRITGDNGVLTTKFQGENIEIKLTQNGTHNITVYTYTLAGNFKETKYTVKIDKTAPNEPTVNLSGTQGENDWHISNVGVEIISNGDVGPSQENMLTYRINNGEEKQIANNGTLSFNEEGIYTLKVYSTDKALNKTEVERVIKIDKTLPTPAEFIINGIIGQDNWYISDVTISNTEAKDNVSGIQDVILSTDRITENTAGTRVTLTTKDNAGHEVIKETVIRLDKSVPSYPIINLTEPTGTAMTGVLLYNTDVEGTIEPGEDYFLPNISNLEKTTYEITKDGGNIVVVPETQETSFNLTEEGIYTINARTYDIAGNVALTSKVIWIDKTKPETPKLISINDQDVSNVMSKEVASTSNVLKLQIDNLTVGNKVTITLIHEYEKVVITRTVIENLPIEIELNEKGTYSIKVTQTNMFGTESDISTGLYSYKYE